MHYLDESHILIFLLQVLLLLGLSRALGLLFARFGQPAITAEILVGVFLGPTILGRISPELYKMLFGGGVVQQAMLDSLAWLGILFFLLVTGLETDLSMVLRQRKNAATISFMDLTIPMIIAFIPSLILPAAYLVNPDQRILFALFIATIMTISALPVTVRILQELKIFQTDVGLLILCALTINDVAGWIVFAVLLGAATGEGMTLGWVVLVLVMTLLFAGVSLSIGRYGTNWMIEKFHKWKMPEPGTSLTFICLLGLLGGLSRLKSGSMPFLDFLSQESCAANRRH